MDGCKIDPTTYWRSWWRTGTCKISQHMLLIPYFLFSARGIYSEMQELWFQAKAPDTYVLSILERFTISGWKYGHSILLWLWRLISDLPAEERITWRCRDVDESEQIFRLETWVNEYILYVFIAWVLDSIP